MSSHLFASRTPAHASSGSNGSNRHGPRGTEPNMSEYGLAYDIIRIPDGPDYDEEGLLRFARE
jgi:hypothetical protein